MTSNHSYSPLPRHVGIIMDGNGRWAAKRLLPRSAGHYEGVKAAKRVTSEAAKLGIPFLTYYAFSTENWRRPEQEVSYLMDLIASRLYGEIDFYQRIGARVLVRGDIDKLPDFVKEAIVATQEATKEMKAITISLAVNYGGQDEIVRAVNRWLHERVDETAITAEDIRDHLDLPWIPPVDLIVRSGGEKRISNFLLWDAAYAELLFSDTLWPDWNGNDLQSVCAQYAQRNRRYGGISE